MAPPRKAGFVGALLLACTALGADPADAWKWWKGTEPLPAGARVRLAVDRQQFFLGENGLLHFTLANAGTEPFDFSVGGDYRGSTRALRYEVTATDQHGQVASDPDAEHQCTGGFSGPQSLKPGE